MSEFPPPRPEDRHEFSGPPTSAAAAAGTRPRRWWWLLLIGIPLIAAIALIATLAGDGDDDESDGASSATVTAPTTAGSPVSTTSGESTTVAGTDPAMNETTTIAATTTEPATTEPPSTQPAETTTTASAPTVPSTTALPPPSTSLPGLVITDVVISPGKEDGEPVSGAQPLVPGDVPEFPSWTNRVCIFWTVSGMPQGVVNGIVWTHEDQVVLALEESELPWNQPSSTDANWCVPVLPVGIDEGQHRIEYFVAGVSQFVAEFEVQG